MPSKNFEVVSPERRVKLFLTRASLKGGAPAESSETRVNGQTFSSATGVQFTSKLIRLDIYMCLTKDQHQP